MKFKGLPHSGHLVIVPPAKRGEPATRYSICADADGIIETDDPAAIQQLRQGGVVEELVEETLVKRAVVEPPAPDKATVEAPPERLRKQARGGKAPAGDVQVEAPGPDGAAE